VNTLWLIAKTRIKILLKRKSLLLLCLILPLVFYSFVGKIFKESDNYDKVPVVLVDEDNSESSSLIINNLKNNEILNCRIDDKKNALKLLSDNKVEGVFILTKNLEKNIEKETLKEIVQVYYLPENNLIPALTDVVAGEMMELICTSEAANTSEIIHKKHNSIKEDVIKAETISFSKKAMKDTSFTLPIEINAMTPDMKTSSLSTFKRSLIPKQSALGMFLLFTTLYLFLNCTSLMKEKSAGVYNRIRISGCGTFKLLSGDLLGIFIVGMLLQIIQLPLLYIMFNVESSIKLLYILIINIFYVFSIASLLIVFTKLFKNLTALQSFMPTFVFFMGLVGGCLWSAELLPKNLHFISILMPTYWAQTALCNVILYSHSLSSIINCLITLFISGSFFFSISYIYENH